MFTNSKITTTALLALTLSMGLSACSPAQNENIPSPSATPSAASSVTASATASPTASEDAYPAESVTPTASETASDSTNFQDIADPSRTAESANETVNDFMIAVRDDTLTLASDPEEAAAMTPEEIQSAFAYSTTYIDTSKFTQNQVGEILESFAAIYMVDPNATIISKDASAMKVSGDTATIEGNAFTVTLNGVEKKGKAGSGGSMTLTNTDGNWKITGYTSTPSKSVE